MERKGIAEEQAAFRADEEQERDPFELANLSPKVTGLPGVVWVSVRGKAKHDACVMVCRRPGDRMLANDLAVVDVSPEPRLVAGKLDADCLAAVQHWIKLNNSTLIDYWDYRIDTGDLLERLKPLGQEWRCEGTA
jgi:hypothetical protein